MNLWDDLGIAIGGAIVLLGWTPSGVSILRTVAKRQRDQEAVIAAQDRTKVELETMDAVHALQSHPNDLARQDQLKEILHQQQVEQETAKLEALQHNRAMMHRAFEAKMEDQDFAPLPPPPEFKLPSNGGGLVGEEPKSVGGAYFAPNLPYSVQRSQRAQRRAGASPGE